MVRPLYSPHLLGVYAAHAVKKAMRNTPVFAVHRILTPEEAEGILQRDEADAITLVRALIADPEWPAKARAGNGDRIDPELMRDLLDTMEITSLCALGGGMPLPIKNALEHFDEELRGYFVGNIHERRKPFQSSGTSV